MGDVPVATAGPSSGDGCRQAVCRFMAPGAAATARSVICRTGPEARGPDTPTRVGQKSRRRSRSIPLRKFVSLIGFQRVVLTTTFIILLIWASESSCLYGLLNGGQCWVWRWPDT